MLLLCLVLCFGWLALRMTGTDRKRTCMRGVMKGAGCHLALGREDFRGMVRAASKYPWGREST